MTNELYVHGASKITIGQPLSKGRGRRRWISRYITIEDDDGNGTTVLVSTEIGPTPALEIEVET